MIFCLGRDREITESGTNATRTREKGRIATNGAFQGGMPPGTRRILALGGRASTNRRRMRSVWRSTSGMGVGVDGESDSGEE